MVLRSLYLVEGGLIGNLFTAGAPLESNLKFIVVDANDRTVLTDPRDECYLLVIYIGG